ncbi:hypothetical protein [Cupriavidus necator]
MNTVPDPSRDLLETIVAAAKVSPGHKQLIVALRRSAGLDTVRLGNQRDGFSNAAERNLVVAPDDSSLGPYREWIDGELAAVNGDWRAVWNKHKGSSLRLTGADVIMIRLVAPYGKASAEFLQLVVSQTRMKIDRPLFSDSEWDAPRSEEDLRRLDNCSGYPYSDPTQFGDPVYALESVNNLADVLGLEVELDEAQKHAAEQKVLRIKDMETGEVRHSKLFEEFPELRRKKPRLARFFADWDRSSAGRSGAELSSHWVFEISDYTDPQTSERNLSVIPAWTTTKRLPKIENKSSRTVFGLWDELLRFDVKAGHPFAWFFFMLHGNRLSPWVGEQILEATEAGRIVMPEWDYRVLKDWSAERAGPNEKGSTRLPYFCMPGELRPRRPSASSAVGP